MKLNFAVIIFDKVPNDNGEKMIKHVCCYENEPDNEDLEDLKERLATDESFEMINDTDYEMIVVDRNKKPELFLMLNLPEEFSGDWEEDSIDQ